MREEHPRDPAAPVELRIDARRLIRNLFLFCLAAEIAFVVLDYFVNFGRATRIGALRRMFNTAREDSLSGWFAVTQTLLVALTVWLIYVVVKRARAAPWQIAGWLVLALFFTWMAVDDGAQLHERLGSTYKAMRGSAPQPEPEDEEAPISGARTMGRFPSYTWQLLFLPAFGALGLFMLFFLWRELGTLRAKLLVALAILCFVVAVGMDFVEGLAPDHPWNLYTLLSDAFQLEAFTERRFGSSPFVTLRHFSKSVEECIEMFGITLLWTVFLSHLSLVGSALQVRFVRRAD